MNKPTCPKHLTPNFRLVAHTYSTTDLFGRAKLITHHTWDPVPLRSNRKDLPTS